MLGNFTLDQLRVLTTIAETDALRLGSGDRWFSQAKLRIDRFHTDFSAALGSKVGAEQRAGRVGAR